MWRINGTWRPGTDSLSAKESDVLTALRITHDELVVLHCDRGYGIDVDRLARRVLRGVAMRLGPIMSRAVWLVVLGVWDAVRVAVLVGMWGMVALLDMVWLHDMVLRRIAQD